MIVILWDAVMHLHRVIPRSAITWRLEMHTQSQVTPARGILLDANACDMPGPFGASCSSCTASFPCSVVLHEPTSLSRLLQTSSTADTRLAVYSDSSCLPHGLIMTSFLCKNISFACTIPLWIGGEDELSGLCQHGLLI
jgi:hypothetical protein